MKANTWKDTILLISTGFLAISLIFSMQWAAIVSLLIGLCGIFSTYLSTRIEWIWTKLGKILGIIIPGILLTLVFYLILYPVSIVSRLFETDPLLLSGKYNSYFLDINSSVEKKDFEKTW